VTRAAALTVLLLAGCAQRAYLQAPPDLFPTGPFADDAPVAGCPVEVESLRTEWQSRPDGPLAIPGGHPRLVLVDVRERAADVEVAGLAVDIRIAEPIRTNREGRITFDDGGRYLMPEPAYAGVRREGGFSDIALWVEAEQEVVVRALLRRRIRGGLFESLSYCFSANAYATLAPKTSYARLVIEEPGRDVADWITVEQY
jgi:hypothetical protein